MSRLAIVLVGESDPPYWGGNRKVVEFFDLKGSLEGVLDGLGIDDYQMVPGGERFHAVGRSALLKVGGEVLGSLGELAASALGKFELEGPIFLFDGDVERMIEYAGDVRHYRKIPRHPAAVRDMAFIVEESVPVGQLLGGIRDAAGSLLEDIQMFDIYRGEQISAGSKSVGFSLSFRAPDRTLTDGEVDAACRAVADQLAARWKASVRGGPAVSATAGTED
jgi:phenylalanyl-tRNA synthetase beta chain